MIATKDATVAPRGVVQLRNLTPAPPAAGVEPSSRNSTPAASNAFWMALRLFAIGTDRPASKFRTVDGPTFAAAATCSWLSPASPRAARQIAGLIIMGRCHDNDLCAT